MLNCMIFWLKNIIKVGGPKYFFGIYVEQTYRRRTEKVVIVQNVKLKELIPSIK